jgi:hypothetical protein
MRPQYTAGRVIRSEILLELFTASFPLFLAENFKYDAIKGLTVGNFRRERSR